MTGRQEPEEAEGGSSERLPKEEKFFENIEEAARKALEKEDRHENYKITAGQVLFAVPVVTQSRFLVRTEAGNYSFNSDFNFDET